MITLRQNGKRAVFLLSSMLAASLSAQTSAPASDTPPPSGDVIELSPFAVTTDKDTGYKASNSIGGTRSNTPIKDIALNIQVFTKELANDLVILDQTQLERYNAALVNGGADVQSDNVIQQAYGAFLFRGFVQNWSMRDGVREYDPVDSVGIARVELVKGPAAALYGLSYAGGVMNTVTKRVDMSKNFGGITATVTDQGGERATIEANFVGKVGSDMKMGVRYNGAAAITKDSREHSDGKTRFNQVNVELDPLPGTQIQLLVENVWKQKPNGLGYYSISPDQTKAADAASGTAAGVFYGKYNVVGIGAATPLQILHPDIPWTWNWATNNVRALETSRYSLTVNQAFGENFHISAYVQNNQREQPDSNGWDDSGNSQNGAGWDTGGTYLKSGWLLNSAGKEVIRRVYHWRDWRDDDHAQGVTGVYKFETGPIKNTLTGGWAHWDEHFTSHKYLTQDKADYQFFDLPVQSGINTESPGEPSDYSLVSPGGNQEHNQNSYEFINWQLSAFENRLKLNAAINRTQIKNLIWPSVGSTAPYNKVNMSKNSPMFGGMFDITKEISIFAVHSTSLFPTTDKNDELTVQMPPEVGKSNEVGVKVELLNGKISGTISYYSIKKTGGGVRDINAENANKVLWDQYHAQGLALGAAHEWDFMPAGWSHDRSQIKSGADQGSNGNLGNMVPAELESKGFEADIVFQPIKTLQLVISYAHNTEESTAGSTKGQSNSGHVKNQLAGLAKYTFDEGSLKGLFMGLGFQAADKSIADYQSVGGVAVARYNPRTFYLEFFSGYAFKAYGLNQKVQINVKNLTQQDDFYGWQNAANNSTLATERYKVPTHAQFSLTYAFEF